MSLVECGSTNPRLLDEVANWQDHRAWVRFRDHYDVLIRRWCRGYGLDDDAVNEVSQEIWIELADRMKTFRYDPAGTFRGWLRRLCGSRTIDFLRRRRHHRPVPLGGHDGGPVAGIPRAEVDDLDDGEAAGASDPFPPHVRREVERIQAAVKARITPHNWEAFWLVAVCDWSVERTAESLGMSHAAVYAAKARVGKMLREEAEGLWGGSSPISR